MTSVKFLTAAAIALTTTLAAPVFAADEYNTTSGITDAFLPLGMHGKDMVAMLDGDGPVDGSSALFASYDGVSYYFSSEANKAKFEADPEAHLVQFGGFCTFAVSKGAKFDGDPYYADIRDGKLYVFVSKIAYDLYMEDPEGTIAKAEAKWPEIRSVAVEDINLG